MTQKRITLRIPSKLYATIVESTELSGKTVTGEILSRIKKSYDIEAHDLPERKMEQIAEKVARRILSEKTILNKCVKNGI